MQEKNLNSWEEFEREIAELTAARQQAMSNAGSPYHSEFIFRGQVDSGWGLDTTLERSLKDQLRIVDYYAYAYSAKSKIETYTGKSWTIPNVQEYMDWLEKSKNRQYFHPEFLAQEYLTYLRHHGYPSPLLDWTLSPYIAAFFAFRESRADINFSSIFLFKEFSGSGKTTYSNFPIVRAIMSDVSADKRHFIQQSKYTFCFELKGEEKSHFYANHQAVIKENYETQDLLWKFNIPYSERKKILNILKKMNINASSLIDSEDSLMETIALDDFYLKL